MGEMADLDIDNAITYAELSDDEEEFIECYFCQENALECGCLETDD